MEPTTGYLSFFVNRSKLLAMWPIWRSGFFFRLWYYTTYFSVAAAIFLTSLTLLFKIITSSADMDGIATVIDFATVYASGVFRFIYIFCRGARYQKLVDTMNQKFAYASFNPTGPILTMGPIKILGDRVGIFYFCASYIFILQMAFGPLFVFLTDSTVSQIPFIFEAWQPLDTTQEPAHTIIYLLQAFSWLTIGYGYLIMDAFWYTVIILTIGQLQIIAHTCKNIENDDESPEIIEKTLITSVKQHQTVRNFIKDIENLLSPIIIVDFMHAVLSITFLMLDITIWLSKGDWIKVINLSEYLIVSLVHMFAFDWLGNELALQEEKVAKALYEIPWYKTPSRKLATTIIFATAASRKPIRLTGGKFYYLTLEFFVLAIKTIFSYFTVLFQLRNDQ